MAEVAGEAALFVPPGDKAALSAAIGRVLGNSELRARLRLADFARAKRFSPEAAARATLAVHESRLGQSFYGWLSGFGAPLSRARSRSSSSAISDERCKR